MEYEERREMHNLCDRKNEEIYIWAGKEREKNSEVGKEKRGPIVFAKNNYSSISEQRMRQNEIPT